MNYENALDKEKIHKQQIPDRHIGGASHNRIAEIDIVKALAIIFMVAGHSGAPFTKFIYLFHMAVFFAASGFFYKQSYSSDLKAVIRFILKKLKDLWMPYFLWTTIYTLLHNVFIRINVYTDNPDILLYVTGTYIGTHDYMTGTQMLREIVKAAFFGGGNQLVGAFWFLKILCLISIAYCVGDLIARGIFKKHILVVQLIISIALLGIGYYLGYAEISFHGIELVCSYYCLFYLGHLLGLYKEKYRSWESKIYLGIFITSFILLIVFNHLGSIGLADNQYENPVFLLMTSFVGWCWLYSIGFLFIKGKKGGLAFKKALLYIGGHTLPIVIFHFLSFKIVNAIVCKVYGLPMFCVAAFPNLYGDKGMWWVAFTTVGIVIPIILYETYKYGLAKVRLLYKKVLDTDA